MKQSIYDFDTIKNVTINDELGPVVEVRDYFQYYTTGLEDVPFDEDCFSTDRYQNERTDVIAYNFFEDENLSDLILAMNNDTYMFDCPVDYDTQCDIVDARINMIEALNHQQLRPGQVEFYRELFDKEMNEINEAQDVIVLPKFNKIAKIRRDMEKYLENREVE
jgi:hypothetical protein